MRSSRPWFPVCLWGVSAAALLIGPPLPTPAAVPPPAAGALSPLQGAREALDRAHQAKGLAELNGSLTSESAGLLGFSLILADSMVSGMTSVLAPAVSPRQSAPEKAFQGKVVALLNRYSLNDKSMKAAEKSGALPPGLAERGHQFLADALALSNAYERSHPSAKGDPPLGEQMGKNNLPLSSACDFHVLGPTRVQIVPRSDPKSPLEAHLEGGQWRLDLGDMGPGASSPTLPKFKTMTPQAASFLKALEDQDAVSVERKLKADPALANTPSAFYHGQSGSVSDIPLSLAAFQGNPEIAALLIRYGANVNAADDFGETALDRAARFSSDAVVKILLAHGANVGHKNSAGQTALHQAVLGDDPVTVALLLAHGADVNARDQDGKTPLATALAIPRQDTLHMAPIVKMLRQHGAKE